MNNCLADLSRLIPSSYLKKGRGRIEKTEIIEMAIKHMKHLQLHSNCRSKGEQILTCLTLKTSFSPSQKSANCRQQMESRPRRPHRRTRPAATRRHPRLSATWRVSEWATTSA